MRHSNKKLQLNRFTSWHKATVISMARSILTYQSIRTTLAKAKASRQLIEKLITLAKENTLSAKRQAAQILNDHKLVSMLFSDIGPRFAKRVGGYTRIINVGKRRGDDAEVVIFELTEIKKKEPKKLKKKEESKPHEGSKTETKEAPAPEKKAAPEAEIKERPKEEKKHNKKFLGGFKNIFRKERRDAQ